MKLAICWEPRESGATAAAVRGGENASGADNQQERPGARRKLVPLLESSEAKRQPPRESEAKIWSEPHGDMWRTRAKFLVG